MDTSEQLEPATTQPQPGLSFTPPHFFKAAYIRKQATVQPHSS
jgi:hypothetical protein